MRLAIALLGGIQDTLDFEFRGVTLTASYSLELDDGLIVDSVYFLQPTRVVSERVYEACLQDFYDEVDRQGIAYMGGY